MSLRSYFDFYAEIINQIYIHESVNVDAMQKVLPFPIMPLPANLVPSVL